MNLINQRRHPFLTCDNIFNLACYDAMKFTHQLTYCIDHSAIHSFKISTNLPSSIKRKNTSISFLSDNLDCYDAMEFICQESCSLTHWSSTQPITPSFIQDFIQSPQSLPGGLSSSSGGGGHDLGEHLLGAQTHGGEGLAEAPDET